MNNNYVLHLCETEKQITDAFKLRYVAYKNAGAIDENEKKEFKDKYDSLENCKTCLVYEDDAAVASIRACVYSKEHNFMHLPSFEVYKEEIKKELGLDKIIVEPNRFVIDPLKVDSKELFKLAFRFITLNILKFDSDYVITAVRAKHMPIYRRFFGMEPISAPKRYPGLKVEMIMMAGECRSAFQSALGIDEIFRFTDEEVNNYIFKTSPALLPVSWLTENDNQQAYIAQSYY